MSINIARTTIGAAALSLTLSPAWAQQSGHLMAGMPQGSGGGAAMCAQNSEGVTRAIDVVNASIEDARQTNDASKLRAAIGDLQVVLAQMKTQLADCVALASEAGGGATGNMPGMDHSKMPTPSGTPVRQAGSTASAPGAQTAAPMAGMDHSKTQMGPKAAVASGSGAAARGGKAAAPAAGMDHSKMQMAPKSAAASGSGAAAPGAKPAAPMAGMDHSKMAGAPTPKASAAEPSKMAGMDHSKMGGANAAPAAAASSSKAPQAPAVVFTLRTQPAPPRSGKNDFEVTVKDADGTPIADAEVSLAVYLPPMPSMNMPEMRNTVQLTSAGNGIYKGSGTMGMAGDWDVTITAARRGQTLGTNRVRLTPK